VIAGGQTVRPASNDSAMGLLAGGSP
jgi:hypothetical protein